MIHLLPDDFFGGERLAEIRRGCGEPDLVALNTTQLDGQRLSLDELAAAVGAMPFLAEKRLVIVRRLVGQYEPRSSDGGSGERRRSSRAERAQALVEVLAQVPVTTELVLLEPAEAAVRSTNPICQAIAKLGGEVMESRQLRPEEVEEWVGRRVRAKGGRMRKDAVAALSAAAGDDLRRLDGEIDKLLIYADGAEVTLSDVRLLVSEAQDDNVFHLVDAIGRRDRRRALGLLRELLGSGTPVPYVLTMVARQFRLLLQTRELLAAGSDQREIAGQLRLGAWQARNLADQARRFSLGDLERAYPRLLATDQAIKTGRLEGGLALDLLVAELTGR